MDRHAPTRAASGHTLIELLLVLGLLTICAGAGAACLIAGLRAQEARGAAQSWQAAAAWAQVGVLWHGGSVRLAYREGELSLTHDLALCGGRLGASAPVAASSANVSRWVDEDGVAVSLTGRMASPDGGGSLYFDAGQNRYRVVLRPETGLTARSHLLVE
jgi:hypothetical protein